MGRTYAGEEVQCPMSTVGRREGEAPRSRIQINTTLHITKASMQDGPVEDWGLERPWILELLSELLLQFRDISAGRAHYGLLTHGPTPRETKQPQAELFLAGRPHPRAPVRAGKNRRPRPLAGPS